MPVPASYDLETFAAYLHGQLRALATHLGWHPDTDDYDEPINDTLLELGVSDITAITATADLVKLRMIGKVMVWRAVCQALVIEINISADGVTQQREAMYQHAIDQLARFENDAMPYLSTASYSVTAATVQRPADNDPYTWDDSDVYP